MGARAGAVGLAEAGEHVGQELRGHHVALDDLQTAHPGRLVDLLLAQDAGPPQDRGERRAQLVGKRGQELVLRPVGDLRLRASALRLAVEQRVGPAPAPG